MDISGLQKLTLLDYPGKVACTVFLYGCNYRCPFCHNAPLVTDSCPPPYMSEEKFLAFLDKRRGILDGVCITGGEPLLRENIIPFALKIKEKGFALKMDTNGSRPDMIKGLIAAGAVDKFAMDIKSSREKYPLLTGGYTDIASVERSVELLMTSGIDYEFRTTVVNPLHTKEDFEAIGEWIRGAAAYFLQRFSDSGEHIDAEGFSAYSDEEMHIFLDTVRKHVPLAKIRGEES